MDTPFTAVPDWTSWENAGAGIAVVDLNGDGNPDVIVLAVDDPVGQNTAAYRVGRASDNEGTVATWGPWRPVPDVRQLDLVVFMVDAPDGPNTGYYRIGWALDADGAVTGGWGAWTGIPDWFPWLNAGADIAVADVDGDGQLDLVVLMVDAPAGANAGYYRSGPLGADGVVTGWRPWVAVPDWRFWENQEAALAVAPLGAAGMPHLIPFAVDNPPGANDGWFRVLDAMTDLEMAPQMGVWRLLEDTSQVLAVHAALLHTGDVMFFAGSSNDPGRHAAHQYGTAVWHYPAPQFSRPDTPVDLFCCGHAFLPDGRLLVAGGTEQYDPFFGLKQAVVFDPTGGPADPASPTGHAGAWTAAPPMAGGRWYPALLPLGDGRVLAVAGLDGTSMLNVVPEIYTDGVGWAARPASQHWPMYGAPVPARRRAGVLQRRPVRRQQRRQVGDLGRRRQHDDRRPRLAVRRHAQPVGQRPAGTRSGPAGDYRRRRRLRHAQHGGRDRLDGHRRPEPGQPGIRCRGPADDARDAPVRHAAARPHRARQRRIDDGGERCRRRL